MTLRVRNLLIYSVLLILLGLIPSVPIMVTTNLGTPDKIHEISNSIVSEEESTWVNVYPPSAPSPRGYFDLVYDNESDIIILMGGFNMISADPYPVNILRDDLWTYSVSSNLWEDRTPVVRPAVRLTRGALAYNSKHDVVILFGGVNGGLFDDTWAYDYNTNTWTNMKPVISPPARDAHQVVYDSQSERIIMFGGRNTTTYWDVTERDFLNDTWVYDYNTNTWTEITPDISPKGRWFFDMVYDSKSDRVILFGGYTSDYLLAGPDRGVKGDTWSFDLESETWIELNTTNNPSPRSYISMVYDLNREKTVLYGGSFGAGGGDTVDDVLLNDTWMFDYTTKIWMDVSDSNTTGHRTRCNMVYCEKTGQIILFGGQLDDEWNSFNNETWLYTPQLTTSATTTTTTTSVDSPPVQLILGLIAIIVLRRKKSQF
ncbi:MAG: Kelch repeat-containing protein [Candidatus Hodarchaeales archaeon]|jgi:N-acetylneuraminic acid mutarotase